MHKEKLTTGVLKQMNRERVYQYIYEQRVTSKQQIVEALGLGLSTVSQNLAALETEGRIFRKGFFDSTGGRKAQRIQVDPAFRIAVGVGLYKEELQIAAVDLYGVPQHLHSIPLPYRDEAAYYQTASDQILRFLKEHRYRPEQILGISLAVQGIVSRDGSRILYGAILKNQDMRLESFSSRLPYPCRLEHDSKAAARLELWQNPRLEHAVILLLNHNLGGAVVVNRQILTGASMHSGAMEHICVQPDGPVCYCGQKGCLEMYCSADALEKLSGLGAKEFFSALRQKKMEAVQLVWQDYLHHLAASIRNLNMVIDAPVILSGYLSAYLNEEDLRSMEREINGSSPFPLPPDSLLLGSYGAFTATIGTALSFVHHFLRGQE